MTVTRPEPPFSAEDGYEWTVVPDEGWSLDPLYLGGPQCVARVKSVRCPNEAVAVLFRGAWAPGGRVTRPWRYCAEHMYGRWIEDGKVVMWRLVAAGVPA